MPYPSTYIPNTCNALQRLYALLQRMPLYNALYMPLYHAIHPTKWLLQYAISPPLSLYMP
nr:MAG TPA: hypothetical protein [Bacteriophage sp.]